MDGDEVLRRVRSEVDTVGLPVIIQTAAPDPAREVELLCLGADDYVNKPIEPERFMLRVQAVPRRAKGQRTSP